DPGTVAVRDDVRPQWILEPARLGPAVHRALRLDADGRPFRPPRRRGPRGRRLVPGPPRGLAQRLQRRLQPAVRAGADPFTLRYGGPAARGSRMARRQPVLRPVGLRLPSHATTTRSTGERI